MANNNKPLRLTDIALGKDLRSQYEVVGEKNSLTVLNSVSFFLSAVCLVFLVAFQMNDSVSLTWFFLSEAVAFLLIPFLARQGFERTSKILLIMYADVGIVILSSVFGGDAMIQAFFIPTMGLSILLFDQSQIALRNIGILFSVFSFIILDYVIFDRINMSEGGFSLVRWSVLTGSFVTTWLIFNTFSEFKEEAEGQTLQLLNKEKKMTSKLSEKQTELEHHIEQLEKAKLELEKSNKAKSDFLATMSHEIRTPMNAILGMAHLLKQEDPREDQVEPIEILDFSGKTLLTLIDDILDFSKIEAGKVEFERTEFRMSKLLDVIMHSFKTTASNKGIQLYTRLDDTIPYHLIGDPARLTQILNNLLSNAIKFTESGEVSLEVSILEEGSESVHLQFTVKDSGIGIAEDKVDTIFESFTQANNDTRRLFGGTGLGLSISKQLAELQGGRISVDSKPGEGSTFTVELAFEKGKVAEGDGDKIHGVQEPSTLKGLKVLLAEDNLVNQKVMERFLKRWDVEVNIVENGVEVLKALNEESFDLILMDLQMPEMDGYEATEQIRMFDDPYVRKIPIIALTAATLTEVRDRVYASGMNDFVTKPFDPSMLEEKLLKYHQE